MVLRWARPPPGAPCLPSFRPCGLHVPTRNLAADSWRYKTSVVSITGASTTWQKSNGSCLKFRGMWILDAFPYFPKYVPSAVRPYPPPLRDGINEKEPFAITFLGLETWVLCERCDQLVGWLFLVISILKLGRRSHSRTKQTDRRWWLPQSDLFRLQTMFSCSKLFHTTRYGLS